MGYREISIGTMTLTWTFIGMAICRSPSSRDQPKLLHLHHKSISPASSTSSGCTSRSTSPSTKAKPVHCLPISDSAAPLDLDIVPWNSQYAYPHWSSCSNGKHWSQYRIDKATNVCLILILPEQSLTWPLIQADWSSKSSTRKTKVQYKDTMPSLSIILPPRLAILLPISLYLKSYILASTCHQNWAVCNLKALNPLYTLKQHRAHPFVDSFLATMRVLNSSQLSKSLPLPFNNSINKKGARQFPVRLLLKREYGHHPNI